jgi:predicted TIM-barrel fold metal-dependent hydrolase
MPIIDADTHVTECDATFSYLDEGDQRFMPARGELTMANGSTRSVYLIDGLPRGRRRPSESDPWSIMGELLDIPARLKAMDDMGVETQVIYPTTFSSGGIESADAELALTRSYNRWLADRTSTSGGRLRWIMLPSFHNMDQTIHQLRWAKDHGAVGVLKKGDAEAGFWPAEPYFYRFYEEAEKLDLPMCFHVGTGYSGSMPLDRLSFFSFHKFHLSQLNAFQTLVTAQVPKKFPKLRWAFVEASASWVPYVLYEMRRILSKAASRPSVAAQVAGSSTFEVPNDVLVQNNIYVSCFVDEDLPTIMKSTGEDSLMVGSDFVHHDFAEELDFMSILQRRVEAGELTQTAVRKMTYDNAKRLYAL